MAIRVPMPGQDHTLLRFNRSTRDVVYLDVICFLVDEVPGLAGSPLPDAVAATGDRLHDESPEFDTAVRMPSGRVVDWMDEYVDDNAWIAAVKARHV